MEWERGDELPGRVMANLKTGGLRDLLESLVVTGSGAGPGDEDAPATESWTPVV